MSQIKVSVVDSWRRKRVDVSALLSINAELLFSQERLHI